MRLPTVRRRHRALRSRRAGGYAAAAHWRARFGVENRPDEFRRFDGALAGMLAPGQDAVVLQVA